MKIASVPFEVTDWSRIKRTEHKGQFGVAYWQTLRFGSLRVRMVEYTAGYVADQWCERGHILLCLQGELQTQLEDGRRFTLTPGQSIQIGDGAEPHRPSTKTGARLFIVD